MPYTSLRVLHPLLRVVPDDLRERYETMRQIKAKFLLALLLERPAGVSVGRYRWRTGLVRLSRKAQQLAELNGIPSQLPYETMNTVVASLRIWLKQRGLPYGVSQRCEAGVGCRGYRYTKEEVQFRVSLIDRRGHLNRGQNVGGR